MTITHAEVKDENAGTVIHTVRAVNISPQLSGWLSAEMTLLSRYLEDTYGASAYGGNEGDESEYRREHEAHKPTAKKAAASWEQRHTLPVDADVAPLFITLVNSANYMETEDWRIGYLEDRVNRLEKRAAALEKGEEK